MVAKRKRSKRKKVKLFDISNLIMGVFLVLLSLFVLLTMQSYQAGKNQGVSKAGKDDQTDNSGNLINDYQISGSDSVANSPLQLGSIEWLTGGKVRYQAGDYTLESPLAPSVTVGCISGALSDINTNNPSDFDKSMQMSPDELEKVLKEGTEIFAVYRFPNGEGEIYKLVLNASDCPQN